MQFTANTQRLLTPAELNAMLGLNQPQVTRFRPLQMFGELSYRAPEPCLSVSISEPFFRKEDGDFTAEFYEAFSQENSDTETQKIALDALKALTSLQRATLPMFPKACDDYLCLVIEAQSEAWLGPQLSLKNLGVQQQKYSAQQKRERFIELVRLRSDDSISEKVKETLLAQIKNLNDSTAFCGLDLSQLDLSAQDLSSLNLIGANFSKTNLTKTNLSESTLYSSTMCFADMTNANLARADLSDGNLEGVILINADLTEANLKSIGLTNANLTNANLAQVKFGDCVGVRLQGATLTNASLTFQIQRVGFNPQTNFAGTSVLLIFPEVRNSFDLDVHFNHLRHRLYGDYLVKINDKINDEYHDLKINLMHQVIDWLESLNFDTASVNEALMDVWLSKPFYTQNPKIAAFIKAKILPGKITDANTSPLCAQGAEERRLLLEIVNEQGAYKENFMLVNNGFLSSCWRNVLVMKTWLSEKLPFSSIMNT